MATQFEAYLESSAAADDFADWWHARWHANPDAAPDRHTARGVWEQSDEAYDAARQWDEDQYWDRRLREAGL